MCCGGFPSPCAPFRVKRGPAIRSLGEPGQRVFRGREAPTGVPQAEAARSGLGLRTVSSAFGTRTISSTAVAVFRVRKLLGNNGLRLDYNSARVSTAPKPPAGPLLSRRSRYTLVQNCCWRTRCPGSQDQSGSSQARLRSKGKPREMRSPPSGFPTKDVSQDEASLSDNNQPRPKDVVLGRPPEGAEDVR